jgi:hypothetical protein
VVVIPSGMRSFVCGGDALGLILGGGCWLIILISVVVVFF